MKLTEAVRVELDHQLQKHCVKKITLSKRLYWPQGKVAKIVTGEVLLKVHELESICGDLAIPLSELFRNAEKRMACKNSDPSKPAFILTPVNQITL